MRNRYNHSRANCLRRDLNPGLMVFSHASSPLDHVDMFSHAYLVVMVPMDIKNDLSRWDIALYYSSWARGFVMLFRAFFTVYFGALDGSYGKG